MGIWRGPSGRVGPNGMSWVFYAYTAVPASLKAVGVAWRDPRCDW